MADAISCRFSNGGLFPTDRFTARAAELFVDGAVYWVNVEAERTEKSHRHEFGWLKTAWQSLPESISHDYPTPEHLRKRALVLGGFYDETVIDAGSNAAALRVCTSIKAFPGETFSMVFVRGPFVIIRRPESQSHRAMGASRFQESKTKILEIVADMLGIEPADLDRQREAA